MSSAFTRTPAGLAEKWRFHNVPTLWVEGPTDHYFYEPVVHRIPCRVEAFHGIENARALVLALKTRNYPFLVLLDGDYGILERRRSPHKHVICLSRYSFENYLWEGDPVTRTCLKYARYGDASNAVEVEMSRVRTDLASLLLEAVILDVAARMTPSPPKVLPARIEQLLGDSRRPDVDPAKVRSLISAAALSIPAQAVVNAREKVSNFLSEKSFTYLLKGHLLFGVLRLIIVRTAETLSGSKCNIDNDALLQLLSVAVWDDCPTDDHNRLRRAIRSKLRKLQQAYPSRTAAS